MPQNSNSEIPDLEKELATCRRDLALFEAELKAAQTDSKADRAKIDELDQAIAALGVQIKNLSLENLRANSTIAAMVSSPSWRLTGPLRKLKDIFSKLAGPRAQNSAAPRNANGTKAGRSESAGLAPLQGEFDEELYLQLYPEVRDHFAGTPHDHYLSYGKGEGRLGALPSLHATGEFARLNPQRDNILVVSHEATATGAPVLSLNIMEQLKPRYNVVSLLLAGGPIVDDFRELADISVGPVYDEGDTIFRYQLMRLLAACRFRFCIVNSAAARMVLPELARHFIPSIALVHEFASSIRPRTAIYDTMFWASETIFSAEIVRNDATLAFPELARRTPVILPQGRCTILPTHMEESSAEIAKRRIQLTFRPDGWPRDTPVVLGIGSINMRKGVDLFVSCAAQVAKALRCRFIWIGGGYDPAVEGSYSMYLEDQIRRAWLSECFSFMNETAQIDFAYQQADVLVLSSRLDPLPNVCIDAMFKGLPVVCFEKTTGIADVLRDSGLESVCIAPYLDSTALASRVVSFLKDPALRQSVGSRLREIAGETFNMPTYIGQIENKALECAALAKQESNDCDIIASNPLLDLSYLAGSPESRTAKDAAVREFVRSWKAGLSLRKPYPGFNPGIYAERCGVPDLSSNPLAHFMQSGSPEGPWLYEVIAPSPARATVTKPAAFSAALQVQVVYPEFIPSIIDRLNANDIRPDLFISVPSETVKIEMDRLLDRFKGRQVEVQIVPQREKHLGSILAEFGERLCREYEFLGFLQIPSRLDVPDETLLGNWIQFFLENLVGGHDNMMDRIISRMVADPSLGLVFPDNPNVMDGGINREATQCLAAAMSLQLPEERYWDYPAGGMFWTRSRAIQPLMNRMPSWRDVPEDPVAIETLLPAIVRSAGYRTAATHIPAIEVPFPTGRDCSKP